MTRLLLLISILLAGCRTATTPGSLYRQTDRLVDLLAEPAYDIGADPNATRFYSFQVPHYDADGHGLFDVPMVFCEQLFFAPTWLFGTALRYTGSESYFDPSYGGGSGARGAALGAARGMLGYGVAVPGVALYCAGVVGALGFDTVFHDLPVIFIGRPIRWVGGLVTG